MLKQYHRYKTSIFVLLLIMILYSFKHNVTEPPQRDSYILTFLSTLYILALSIRSNYKYNDTIFAFPHHVVLCIVIFLLYLSQLINNFNVLVEFYRSYIYPIFF